MLRKGSQYGFVAFRRHAMINALEVPSKDRGFQWLWITQNAKRAQHISVEMTFHQNDTGRVNTKFDFIPRPGTHFFSYKNHWITEKVLAGIKDFIGSPNLLMDRSIVKDLAVKMFNKREAVDFLERAWGVENVEKKLRSDRKHLLEEIILVIRGRVPFQFLTFCEMLLTPPQKRTFPSFENMKKDCMTGHGGTCAIINCFTFCLLEALGFSARMCLSTVSTTIHINHIVVLVENLEKKRDLHLVDCGLSLPSFRAISLNFDEESAVYQDSYLEYKLIRHDGLILRMHGRGNTIKRNDPPIEGLDFVVGKWRRYYRFNITNSISPDELSAVFQVARFPSTLQPLAVRFPEGRTIMILRNQLVVEQEDGTFKKTMMESDEEILRHYKEHFPTIREDTVRQAYFAWRRMAIGKL